MLPHNTQLLLSLFFSLTLCCYINGQQIIEHRLESFDELDSGDQDLLYLQELLNSYKKSPLNLNNASYEELIEISILNPSQINALREHIHKYGDLIAIEELQSIPGFYPDDIQRIRSYVTITKSGQFQKSLISMIKESESNAFIKTSRFLEKKSGFRTDSSGTRAYLGNQEHLFVRYKANYENRLKFGFIMEKDAGESLRHFSKSAGFDFLTAHFYLKDYSHFLKDLVIGDFVPSMGQGLIAHNDFAARKSPLINNIIRGGRFIRPYNSVSENSFYRGIAFSLRALQGIETSLFVSNKRRDANLVRDSLATKNKVYISSLPLSGNHRTVNELADRRSTRLFATGGRIALKLENTSIAVNGLLHQFEHPIQRENKAHNLFRFEGSHLFNLSLDFNHRYRNINFFGESAYASSSAIALLSGVLIGLHRNINLSILYRNYPRNYNALDPNAFGEYASVNNERGIYMGLMLKPTVIWKVRAYLDRWESPWLRFGINQPSHGREYLIRVDYELKRKHLFYMQMVYEEKMEDYISTNNPIKKAASRERYRFRVHFNNHINKKVELRTRLELTRFVHIQSQSRGVMLFQDIIYKSIESPLSFTFRMANFDTDDYDSRIYAYENTVLNEFRIPAYFRSGIRYYLNLRYKLKDLIMAELRYARTQLSKENGFGTGNEQIEGDKRTEFKFQLRAKF